MLIGGLARIDYTEVRCRSYKINDVLSISDIVASIQVYKLYIINVLFLLGV